MSVVKRIMRTKILVSEKLNKIGYSFYQTDLFMARKNRLSFKIENSTILIIFEMISLK